MERADKPSRQAKRDRPFVPLDEALNDAALAYVAQYASSTLSLRRVLRKHALRWQAAHPEHVADADEVIAVLIARFERAGYLDDRKFAENKAAALRARGASSQSIRAMLQSKGVSDRAIVDALGAPSAEAELAAARTVARKKRLGAYASTAPTHDELTKHLAKLARAGFSYEIARAALRAEHDEAIAVADDGDT